MNWKIYKKMTLEQRTEWDYRFNYTYIRPNPIMYATILTLCMISFNITFAFMYQSNLVMNDALIRMALKGSKLIFVFGLIYVLDLFIQIGLTFRNSYLEKRWLKENKVIE